MIFNAFLGRRCRHGKFFGHGENQIRLADFPIGFPFPGRREIFVVAFGSTAVEPLQQDLPILGKQPAVVGEMAIAGIRIPGRHALVFYHFADRVSPGDGVVIGEKRKWTDLPRPMAFLTVLLKNRGHVSRVNNLALFLRGLHASDQAAGHRSGGHADRPATENFLQGFGQIASSRLGALNVDAELIVNATLIPNDAFGIEQKSFRRASSAEQVGYAIALVFEHGKCHAVISGMLGDTIGRVLLIGIEGYELNSPRTEFALQVHEARHESVVDGTFGPDERDHNPFLVLEITEPDLPATSVWKLEIGDFLANGARSFFRWGMAGVIHEANDS